MFDPNTIESEILNQIPLLLYIIDHESHEVIYANEKSRDIFGDYTGKKCWEYIHGRNKGPCPNCVEFNKKDFSLNQGNSIETEFFHKPSDQWYRTYVTPITWKNNSFVKLEIAHELQPEHMPDNDALTNENARIISEITNFFNAIDYFENKIKNTLELIATSLNFSNAFLIGTRNFDSSVYIYEWNENKSLQFKDKVLTIIDKELLLKILNRLSDSGILFYHTSETTEPLPYYIKAILDTLNSQSIYFYPIRLESAVYGFIIFSDTKKIRELYFDEQKLVESSLKIISNALMRNIIENEIMESQVKFQKLNATKDKFFSIIAHDLKNPFHAITGFTEILLDDNNDFSPDKTKEIIRLIHDSSKSASALLENLLQWSRAQTGQIQYLPQSFDLSEVIDSVLLLFRVNATRKNITIDVSSMDKKIVYADKNMISTVIQNLLNNAIKFTPENGLIKIYATDKDKKTELIIQDNGIGINSLIAKDLFKIDKKIIHKGTSGEKGTGLGLLICQEFIKLNKGEIFLDSEENIGTKAHIILPSR